MHIIFQRPQSKETPQGPYLVVFSCLFLINRTQESKNPIIVPCLVCFFGGGGGCTNQRTQSPGAAPSFEVMHFLEANGFMHINEADGRLSG